MPLFGWGWHVGSKGMAICTKEKRQGIPIHAPLSHNPRSMFPYVSGHGPTGQSGHSGGHWTLYHDHSRPFIGLLRDSGPTSCHTYLPYQQPQNAAHMSDRRPVCVRRFVCCPGHPLVIVIHNHALPLRRGGGWPRRLHEQLLWLCH